MKKPQMAVDPREADKLSDRLQALLSVIRSMQELLGHADLRTTMIYVQLARAMRGEITSPLDDL